MADEKPIKLLACDDPRRQRYAERWRRLAA